MLYEFLDIHLSLFWFYKLYLNHIMFYQYAIREIIQNAIDSETDGHKMSINYSNNNDLVHYRRRNISFDHYLTN